MDAKPPVLLAPDGTIATTQAFERHRASLKRAFETYVYGPMPQAIAPAATKRAIAPEDAGGVPGVEQWEVSLGIAGRCNLVLVLPPGVKRPPVILAQNFCGLAAAFPGRPQKIAAPLQPYPMTCRPLFDPVMRALLGACINGPPFEEIASRGYGLALFYPGDVVADYRALARQSLALFAPGETGMVMGWAWTHIRMLEVLQADERVDASRIVAWGQSRNGKAALVAAAFDERFAGACVFQSGRGGDALTAHRMGESVASATRMFPHWFAPSFRSYAETDPPVDQHQLLALLAPRPLFLGHAESDKWADGEGASLAIAGARPAFELYGAPGPEDFTRPGWHGIKREDWRATLDFLDRRLI
jgi:hypothetical protein